MGNDKEEADKVNEENPVVVEEKTEQEPEQDPNSSDDRLTTLENRTSVNEQKLEELSGQLSGMLGTVEGILKPESDSTPASLPWTHRGRRR